jgi:hypothetical protein
VREKKKALATIALTGALTVTLTVHWNGLRHWNRPGHSAVTCQD